MTICSACGEECSTHTVDEGIGSFEFWGERGVHHDYHEVSKCCDSDVADGGNKIVENSVHVARRDHKDGKVKAGEKYRRVVEYRWRANGPGWFVVFKFRLSPEGQSLGRVRGW